MRKRTVLVSSVAAALTLMVAGPVGADAGNAAGENPAAIHKAHEGNAWQPAPARPGERVYAGFGLRLAAGGTDEARALSPAQYASLVSRASEQAGAFGVPATAVPVVTTGLLTDGDVLDGPAPTFVQEPVLVLTWHGTPLRTLYGPAGQSSSVREQMLRTYTCDTVSMASTTTLDVIESFQSCTS